MTSTALSYGTDLRERHHIPQPLSWAGKGWQVVEDESQDHTVDGVTETGQWRVLARSSLSPQLVMGGKERWLLRFFFIEV